MNEIVVMVNFQWGYTILASGRTTNGAVGVPNVLSCAFQEVQYKTSAVIEASCKVSSNLRTVFESLHQLALSTSQL